MKGLKQLGEEVQALIAAMTISDEALIHEWQTLGQMERSFSSCSLTGELAEKYKTSEIMGYEMEDDDYIIYFNQKMPLEAWIKEQRQRRLHPFGGGAAPGGAAKSKSGDITDLAPDAVRDKLKKKR